MATRVLIVQHGEKERLPGDPGLTALGRSQAATTATWLTGTATPSAIWCSPLRRARETAGFVADLLGLEVTIDGRLRERMSWNDPADQSFDAFLDEWRAATADRSLTPSSGDSSTVAAARFLEALADLAASRPGGTAVVVAHGGVTTDALRTLLGDDELESRAPGLIEHGVPSCAITTLEAADQRWSAISIASTRHLRATSSHRPG